MPFASSLARSAVLAAGLLVSACASTQVVQRDPVSPTNVDAGVAVKGYDPVAYFSDRKPVPRTPAIATRWHYAPQYGGFCAFAISRGRIADIDPSDWAVVDNHLYLNNNAGAQAIWDLDRPGNIQVGNHNWPLVPKLAEPAG